MKLSLPITYKCLHLYISTVGLVLYFDAVKSLKKFLEKRKSHFTAHLKTVPNFLLRYVAYVYTGFINSEVCLSGEIWAKIESVIDLNFTGS